MATNKHTSGFGIAKQELHGEPDIHDRNKASDNPSDEADAVKKPSELDVALTRKWEAEAHFIKTAKTKKELADADLSEWKALEADSQIGKLAAETHFISQPQTNKTYAEAALAEARRIEAIAEVERLKVERLRLLADIKRTRAERDERHANAKFTEGVNTYKTQMEAEDTKLDMKLKKLSSGIAIAAFVILFVLVLV